MKSEVIYGLLGLIFAQFENLKTGIVWFSCFPCFCRASQCFFLWLARSCFMQDQLLFASVFMFYCNATEAVFHVLSFISDWVEKWHARMWDKVMGPRGREWEKGGGGGVKERVMGAHQRILIRGFWSWSWPGLSDGRSTGEGGSRARGAPSPSSSPCRKDRGEAGQDQGASSSPT